MYLTVFWNMYKEITWRTWHRRRGLSSRSRLQMHSWTLRSQVYSKCSRSGTSLWVEDYWSQCLNQVTSRRVASDCWLSLTRCDFKDSSSHSSRVVCRGKSRKVGNISQGRVTTQALTRNLRLNNLLKICRADQWIETNSHQLMKRDLLRIRNSNLKNRVGRRIVFGKRDQRLMCIMCRKRWLWRRRVVRMQYWSLLSRYNIVDHMKRKRRTHIMIKFETQVKAVWRTAVRRKAGAAKWKKSAWRRIRRRKGSWHL